MATTMKGAEAGGGEGAAGAGRRLTKNEKRRQKKKEPHPVSGTADKDAVAEAEHSSTNGYGESKTQPEVEVEYVSADLSLLQDPVYEQFKQIFEKFANPEELTKEAPPSNDDDGEGPEDYGRDYQQDEQSAPEVKKLSKKKKRLMSRLSVAELKQLVQRPDVVEAHDVTSSDPRLLVFLKGMRNTVPVPRHWCHKRKYLQGKRGIEKPPFRLPEYIADTGIARIRESILESDAMKKSKTKARERMQPKMGKIDIDYQVLHDAFFKFQTKPKMTEHGDLYFEGKEFEVDMKEKKPGVLSPELIQALGMLEGAPPPWLVNMQRYGPPPSYPHLKIPGLNAPIPEGCSYGYHPGGWGKPPVDEYGRPLYGDVFGTFAQAEQALRESIDRSHWGELGAMSSESEESSESEAEEEEADEQSHQGRVVDSSGVETPMTLSGMSSVTSGLETPDTVIDLRKREGGTETPDLVASSRELYQVIQEKKPTQAGQAIYGSDRAYVLPGKDGDTAGIESGAQGSSSQNPAEGGAEDDDERNDPRAKRKRRTESSTTAKRQKDFRF